MGEILNFLHMGGYAWFVWPSFALSFIVLWANVWISRWQFRRALQETTRRVAAQAQKERSKSA